jgi:hypothetical protein
MSCMHFMLFKKVFEFNHRDVKLLVSEARWLHPPFLDSDSDFDFDDPTSDHHFPEASGCRPFRIFRASEKKTIFMENTLAVD